MDDAVKDYKYYTNLGIEETNKGNFDGAIEALDKAIELKSDFDLAYFSKAIAFLFAFAFCNSIIPHYIWCVNRFTISLKRISFLSKIGFFSVYRFLRIARTLSKLNSYYQSILGKESKPGCKSSSVGM